MCCQNYLCTNIAVSRKYGKHLKPDAQQTFCDTLYGYLYVTWCSLKKTQYIFYINKNR